MTDQIQVNLEHQRIKLKQRRYFTERLIQLFNEAKGDALKLVIDIEIFIRDERVKTHDLANQIQTLQSVEELEKFEDDK